MAALMRQTSYPILLVAATGSFAGVDLFRLRSGQEG
jgi:hypothetical protein